MATPFTPRAGATVSITVTGSSQRVAIPDTQQGVDIRIFNNDTQVVHINMGDVTVTAATTNLPIAPGAVEVLHFPNVAGARYVAAIGTAANSKNIYFTPGSGI